jgi:hypothetical protein
MEIKRVYICSVCETVHDDEWAAEECCPPEVWEMWQCPVCEGTHDTEEEALDCYNKCLGNDDPLVLDEGANRKYPEMPWSKSPSMYIREFERLNHLKGEQ